MTKKILAILLLVALLCSCSSKPADFRNAKFGMSRTQVERKEDAAYDFASDDLIFYNGEMNGEKVEVYYHFVDDALVDGECRVVIDGRIISDIIESYKSMAAYLTGIYGEPLNADYRVWLNDDEEYRNDPEQLLLYNKFLEYRLEWQTDTAAMELTLNYKDEQINYVYYSRSVNYGH